MTFQKVTDAEFLRGEHDVLRFWNERRIFERLREQNAAGEPWSFLDGPITANNPMGVHHAWGRTYKDAFQRFQAMQGRSLRYQNGFDCQGLWVEVEVQKELGLNTKDDIERFGMDRFVNECKKRVLRFAARQTEQSIRLGYWMDWDHPNQLRMLADALGVGTEVASASGGHKPAGVSVAKTSGASGNPLTPGPPHGEGSEMAPPVSSLYGEKGKVTYTTASGERVTDLAHRIVERLGNRAWGGSYFTFSTENNETIWTFLKKCFARGKVYRGHDVMPWSGLAGSAYSQMEVADGRRLTTHRSVFVRLPIVAKGGEASGGSATASNPVPLSLARGVRGEGSESGSSASFTVSSASQEGVQGTSEATRRPLTPGPSPQGEGSENSLTTHHTPLTTHEYLLVWTTTPWTLTSNVAAAVNPDLDYVKLQAKRDGAIYYFAKDNLEFKRLDKEFKEGFGRPEWGWPEGVPKLKTLSQIFKEQGGYEILGTLKGAELIGWHYAGPFDGLPVSNRPGGVPRDLSLIAESVRIALSAMRDTTKSVVSTFKGGSFHPLEFSKFLTRFLDGIGASSSQRAEADAIVARYERSHHLGEFGGSPNGLYAVATLYYLLHLYVRSITDERARFAHLRTITPDVLNSCTTSGLPVTEDADVATERLRSAASLLHAFNLPEEARSSEAVRQLVADTGTWDDPPHSDLTAAFSDARRLDVFADYAEFSAEEYAKLTLPTAVECHRVIDGGRDNKGNANVTAGEGTGIVHIAPGCGDIDHKLGIEHGVVSVAPLAEDGTFLNGFGEFRNGTFVEGFGEFTGMKATSNEVPELVLKRLKEKGFHVADEVYPHIYPFCWRTGDELVFRLVDEWFIDMDWREEIKDVVRAIRWLPQSIQGEERELEWLTTMRDWMISKKRFWGLALPVWVDEQTGDFEVIGSLAELKERAVEGWDAFEGNTPHRPWIDAVKIRNPKTGNLMSRVPDVGNPWLDAGIVAFSTMGYNIDREYWRQWYPADLVLECFPGQFRNWFYSLLSMSTMMRHGETDDPQQKRPFKTLFGHRLVMNEEGQPMHKSDGTAIWFEEAAEQLGVDTLRWMYLAQNPASDLRFGTRHPDQPVTLQTVDGPVEKTNEGFTTCLVTSKPADEVRRQVLIPLWNSYAFFVNYARLDGFDPKTPAVPYAERPEIDRWVLSNLQSLIETSERAWSEFDPAEACRAAAAFVDDLSNWYIRRNRRRFWRGGSLSRSQGSGLDVDKLAAYQTLYEVLVTLTKLLAPAVPFLCERMYQNLVSSQGSDVPESVHLCRFPKVNLSLKDPGLSERTALAQRVVAMGHKLREEAGHRVRQPLAELRFAAPVDQAAGIEQLSDVIAEELNVKTLTRAEHLDELVKYTYKPNLKTLGPKYGKRLAAIRNELPALGDEQLAPLRRGENVTVIIGGEPLELAPEDVMVGTEQAAEWVTTAEGNVQIALSTKLTPELIREGLARDFVRQIQQLRKDAGLEIEDHISIVYDADGDAAEAVKEFADYIKSETLAEKLEEAEFTDGEKVRVGDAEVRVKIEKVS